MSHIDKNKEIAESELVEKYLKYAAWIGASGIHGAELQKAYCDFWLAVLSRREQEIKEFVEKKKAEAEKLHAISEGWSTSGYIAACDDILSLLK